MKKIKTMNRYKLTTQRTMFKHGEIISENNRIKSKEIEASTYYELKDEVEITLDNVHVSEELNLDYKIGDIYYGPITHVIFYDNEKNIIEKVNVFADPYYTLEEFDNGRWKTISKHKCDTH